jgi:hypothetical protein
MSIRGLRSRAGAQEILATMTDAGVCPPHEWPTTTESSSCVFAYPANLGRAEHGMAQTPALSINLSGRMLDAQAWVVSSLPRWL